MDAVGGDVGESPSTSASAEVVFKKPVRRFKARKRERTEDEDDDATTNEISTRCACVCPPPPFGPELTRRAFGLRSTSLETMRELQRQRQRVRGVTLEPKGTLDAVDEVLANEKAPASIDHSLDMNFTTQADAGDIDQNMLRYIEEQMNGGGGGDGSAEQQASQLDPEEAELYTTPAHLLGVVPGEPAAAATEDSANRWLAGIMEVPLSTEDKMSSIEQTEKAKRAMMERQRDRQAFHEREKERDGHKMAVPGNYNSNFHQHRRENALAKKAQFGGSQSGPPKGGGGGQGGGLASDSAAFGRFRAHERRMGRK